ncbi:MAG: CoA-binding protein [Candidatus Magasanikbacteria bacterium]|nr:CoA-binding protein [Candidatus Magasanikbacteria bacterium]
MGILLSEKTKVLIQGITGKEGQKAVKAMSDYHTQVVCGVTPKKGGQEVEGRPVFNSVKEALSVILSPPRRAFGETGGTKDPLNQTERDSSATPAGAQNDKLANVVSAVYVPPFAAKAAILEAVEAGIPLINIIVERIPIKDTAYCLAAAKEKNIRIIGPSSLGFIVPGVGRIGVVGGPLVNEIFQPGSIGVISRSGGMTNELSWQIRKGGLGQSAAVHVGGDLLMGTTYADLLLLFEKDEQTKAVVIFGEHGGSYEFEIVEAIKKKEFTKPLAIYIGGKFANVFPEGMNVGHAGAIVARGQGAAEKEAALASVGVKIAERYEDLVELVKPYV